MAKYHCKHCEKTVERRSTKQWIKSYCDRVGRDIHLIRVKGR